MGDWDGDGLDDVAFGAVGAGTPARPNAGVVYVILGRRDPGAIDVRRDTRVVRIDGPSRGSEIGRSFGAAGDVDGDGRSDLVVPLTRSRAVIVRGGISPGTSIDLARPPAHRTIELRGLARGDARRRSDSGDDQASPGSARFAPVGDIDGDGRGDVLVGVPSGNGLRGRGRAFVVRGDAAGSTIDATESRALIARVVGPSSHPGFGDSVATTPDIDGDQHPEWIVGASVREGVSGVGAKLPNGGFIVFSRARGEVRPGRVGEPVVTIDARGQNENAGRLVAGIPDVTGDNVADLLIGLPDANPSCRSRAGAIALLPAARLRLTTM